LLAGWGFRGRCAKCSVGYVSGICGRSGSLKKFNLSLNEDINIRFVSITETCTHTSRKRSGCLPDGGARGEDFALSEIPHPYCVLQLATKVGV
jgi:hypothetical protein